MQIVKTCSTIVFVKDSSLKQVLFSSSDSDRSLQDVINEKEDLQMKVLVCLFIFFILNPLQVQHLTDEYCICMYPYPIFF